MPFPVHLHLIVILIRGPQLPTNLRQQKQVHLQKLLPLRRQNRPNLVNLHPFLDCRVVDIHYNLWFEFLLLVAGEAVFEDGLNGGDLWQQEFTVYIRSKSGQAGETAVYAMLIGLPVDHLLD